MILIEKIYQVPIKIKNYLISYVVWIGFDHYLHIYFLYSYLCHFYSWCEKCALCYLKKSIFAIWLISFYLYILSYIKLIKWKWIAKFDIVLMYLCELSKYIMQISLKFYFLLIIFMWFLKVACFIFSLCLFSKKKMTYTWKHWIHNEYLENVQIYIFK